MQIAIRPLGPDDAEAIVRLSLRAWAPVFDSLANAMGPGLFRHLHPDWRVDQENDVRAACATKQTWVAEIESEVVGFVAVELRRAQSEGEIHMLAVDPDHQERGIGTTLTSFAVDRIREAGMTLAIVETGGDPGHAPARRTYEKAGFTVLPIARHFLPL